MIKLKDFTQFLSALKVVFGKDNVKICSLEEDIDTFDDHIYIISDTDKLVITDKFHSINWVNNVYEGMLKVFNITDDLAA